MSRPARLRHLAVMGVARTATACGLSRSDLRPRPIGPERHRADAYSAARPRSDGNRPLQGKDPMNPAQPAGVNLTPASLLPAGSSAAPRLTEPDPPRRPTAPSAASPNARVRAAENRGPQMGGESRERQPVDHRQCLQLSVLRPQLPDLLRLLGGHTRALAGIDLRPADRVLFRLRSPDRGPAAGTATRPRRPGPGR